MSEKNSKNDLVTKLTASIVSAYVRNHIVPTSSLKKLISNVDTALRDTYSPLIDVPVVERPKPAVSIRKSIQDDQLTCLECGNNFKSLKRHLATHHSKSPEEYRDKWSLPADYPMVALAYAQKRSLLARESGLGHIRRGKR
jgi:predicted transcriptional regulator